VIEHFEISGRGAHMTYRGHLLKMRLHHNIRAGNHGNVRDRKGAAKTTRYSASSATRQPRMRNRHSCNSLSA
jgi:hypothetical protein